jgi:hypothetical protein
VSRRRSFHLAKRFVLGRQIPLLLVLLCVTLYVSLCSITTPTLAAPVVGWAATYGGNKRDEAHYIQQTGDGGYIVAGATGSFGAGEADAWIIKLSPDGTVDWQKAYGGDRPDAASSIQQTDDGGYIVAGATKSFGAGDRDIWILRLRPDGTIEWQNTYGGDKQDAVLSLQLTNDKGYIVAGVTGSLGPDEDFDVWILKLSPDGTVEWQKIYGGPHLDLPFSIQQTRDGGYVVAGTTKSFGAGGLDLWVLKLKCDGVVEWETTYGGVYSDSARSIRQTGDGGYIVASRTSSIGAEEVGLGWVLKLSPDGALEWHTTYGKPGFGCVVNSIEQTGDGGYIAAGGKGYPGAREDVWVMKLGRLGGVEWQRTYGREGYEGSATAVRQTGDRGYIVVGYMEPYGTGGDENRDILVIKLRADGTITPSCDFVRDTTGILASHINVVTHNSSSDIRDSNVIPQGSSATVQDTHTSANILCTSTAGE